MKCGKCRRNYKNVNRDGFWIVKYIDIIEADPKTGKVFGICKFCEERNWIPYLNLKIS